MLCVADTVLARFLSRKYPLSHRKSFTADWLDALREGFMFNLRPRQKGKV
jgi:hypothetical protein